MNAIPKQGRVEKKRKSYIASFFYIIFFMTEMQMENFSSLLHDIKSVIIIRLQHDSIDRYNYNRLSFYKVRFPIILIQFLWTKISSMSTRYFCEIVENQTSTMSNWTPPPTIEHHSSTYKTNGLKNRAPYGGLLEILR